VYHWDGSAVVVGSGHLADAVEPIKKNVKKKALAKIMDYFTNVELGQMRAVRACLDGSIDVDVRHPRTLQVRF
jgi:hypothetical protein